MKKVIKINRETKLKIIKIKELQGKKEKYNIEICKLESELNKYTSDAFHEVRILNDRWLDNLKIDLEKETVIVSDDPFSFELNKKYFGQ